MWFTRVSLQNPVFATMVMLAIVVLGLFSYQRLRVDQFPNIDFPVVVVTAEYPGASPEIIESEVTRKIEEGVNSIAGIKTLTSRSYEAQSVVIIEFQLHVDGRKAAEDVREKVATLRPLFRDEVKEPRVLRYDPSSRAIWSVAVVSEAATEATSVGANSPTAGPPQGGAAPSGGSAVREATSVGATFLQWNCTVCLSIRPASLQAATSSSFANRTCSDESCSSSHQAIRALASSTREAASRASRRGPGTGVKGGATTALG